MSSWLRWAWCWGRGSLLCDQLYACSRTGVSQHKQRLYVLSMCFSRKLSLAACQTLHGNSEQLQQAHNGSKTQSAACEQASQLAQCATNFVGANTSTRPTCWFWLWCSESELHSTQSQLRARRYACTFRLPQHSQKLQPHAAFCVQFSPAPLPAGSTRMSRPGFWTGQTRPAGLLAKKV